MRRLSTVAVVAAALLPVACGNGETILNAGNDRRPPCRWKRRRRCLPATTLPPGETLAARRHSATDDTRHHRRTTTIPLDDLPSVPSTRSTRRSGPVELTFWHGLNAESETALTKLTDAYNASQSKVRVELQNQGGYEQTIDKYVQSSQGSRPDVVIFPEYVVQQMADTDSVIPIAGVPGRVRLRHQHVPALDADRVLDGGRAVGHAVQRQQPGPVLQQADLRGRRARPRQSSAIARGGPAVLATDRRLRRGIVRARPRQWHRLRWRLVPRAMARQGGRVLRRQRQRPPRRRRRACSTTKRPASSC